MRPRVMHARLIAMAAFGVALAMPVYAFGSNVLLGNYPITNDVELTPFITNQRRRAMEFSIPSGFNYVITSITLRFSSYDANDLAILQIRDHNGISTSPGAGVVGAFTAPTGTGSAFTDYVFAPSSTIVLQENTSYWLHLQGASANTFNWRGSSPAIVPTGIGVFGPGNLQSDTSGATWQSTLTLNSFVINGFVVPEPASLSMLGLGAISILRRRPMRRGGLIAALPAT